MLQKVLQTETGKLRGETRYAEGNEVCTEAPAEKNTTHSKLTVGEAQ